MLVAVAAFIASLAGLGLVVMNLADGAPVIAERTEATIGDVSLWVDNSEWLAAAHEDDTGGGIAPAGQDPTQAGSFAMPNSMMGGTPDEGFLRLQLDVSMANNGSKTATVDASAFRLEDSEGHIWSPMRGGTLAPAGLLGGHSLHTVVAFDIPEIALDETMYFVWSAAGKEHTFAISDGGHHG